MKIVSINRVKLVFWLGHLCFLAIVSALMFWMSPATAAEAAAAAATVDEASRGWGFLAAAVSTGLAALGAGIAVSNVGSAAIGAMLEKPEILGRALMMIGLAEGIAIYGLIISILILNQII